MMLLVLHGGDDNGDIYIGGVYYLFIYLFIKTSFNRITLISSQAVLHDGPA